MTRIADPAALRQTFADPEDRLILIAGARAGTVKLALALLAERNHRVRAVVFGTDGAGDAGPRATVLAPWAAALRDDVEGIVDGTVQASGEESADALADLLIPPSRPSTSPSAQFVLTNDWGIGDELLLSAVAREVSRERPDVRLWIRSRHGFPFPPFVRSDAPPPEARSVEVIYQNPVLYGPSHHSPFPGHLVQQMLDKFCLETGIRVVARDVRPALAVASHPGRGRGTRSVVLHSGTNPRLPSKDWGLERWIDLCRRLRAAGVEVVQVGAADEPALPDVRDLRGRPPSEAPDIVARCGAVVCLVGFLMHVAAAVNAPAVVIYGGREHPAIDGYPDQVHLSSGPLECRGRWGCHLAPDHACPHGMKCMDELSPELVADEVLELLEDVP